MTKQPGKGRKDKPGEIRTDGPGRLGQKPRSDQNGMTRRAATKTAISIATMQLQSLLFGNGGPVYATFPLEVVSLYEPFVRSHQ